MTLNDYYNEAVNYYDYGEYEGALELLYPLSQQNHPQATFLIGCCFLLGKGVERSNKQALNYFKKASLLGLAEASRNLALCYERGVGVKEDFQKATEYYILSAKQGDKKSQLYIGLRYLNGDRIQQDYHSAVYWLKKAASQGSIEAKEALKKLNLQ